MLILGSGYVVPPALKYLSSIPGVDVTVASNTDTASIITKHGGQSTLGTFLDVQDKAKLGELVSRHDVVLSFLPATMHVLVAEACIEGAKHLDHGQLRVSKDERVGSKGPELQCAPAE